MQKIVIIGAGNVSTHLFRAFKNSEDVDLIQVYNRSKKALKPFAGQISTTTSLSTLKPADIYLVAVTDDAVREVVKKLKAPPHTLVAHTSGSVPLLTDAKDNGVFYPLQTFSKQRKVNFSEIPIGVEAESDEGLKKLHQLGKTISNKVFALSTEQRKSLHLAAVFACNFTNHLYRIAEKICDQNGVPFDTLHALIAETAHKAQTDSPKNVQTGPAKRSDEKTLNFHLSQLESPELKEIYTLLTHSIQKEDGSKL